jgi:ABC-type uncharacterized transport system substrate-binding protein
MKVFSSKRISDSCSDNLKSKIKNPKSVGLVALGVAFAMCGAVAEAQQQTKVAKLGWLGGSSADRSIVSTPVSDVVKRNLRALGYVEGKNIAFEYRFAENKLDRFPALADELVRHKVDVILTTSLVGALAAKNATRTIPIVFMSGGDPVAAGLVDSLARPGGNVTGVTAIPEVLAGKRLELLKDTLPKRCCGIHRIQPLRNNGKKANCQRGHWACSFIPWRQAAPTNSRAHSKKQLRRVAPHSPSR